MEFPPCFPKWAQDQLSALVWGMGMWNLELIWDLLLVAWNFSLTSVLLCLRRACGLSENELRWAAVPDLGLLLVTRYASQVFWIDLSRIQP
jgi:hypothetical protein